MPFADSSFDLVTSRHPVHPDWAGIHRVLRLDGRYLAQHVGPASAFELIEAILGPQPQARRGRHHDDELAGAQAAGLTIENLRTASCRMEFHDIGAVVWILRKGVWWVPGFTSAAYDPQLRALDERLRSGGPFVAPSTRHLIIAHR